MINDKCILIVEDDDKNMKLLRDILQFSGYKVLEAYDGQEGVEIARNKMPSLILLDWQLPEMTGGEVIKKLKEDIATAGIPVIVVSALAMPDSIINIRQSGCDDYITKPINVPIFLKIIKRYLPTAKI